MAKPFRASHLDSHALAAGLRLCKAARGPAVTFSPCARAAKEGAKAWVDPEGYAKYDADQRAKFEAVVKAEAEAAEKEKQETIWRAMSRTAFNCGDCATTNPVEYHGLAPSASHSHEKAQIQHPRSSGHRPTEDYFSNKPCWLVQLWQQGRVIIVPKYLKDCTLADLTLYFDSQSA